MNEHMIENSDSLLNQSKRGMESALDHYRAVPNVHTWQKFHQALKHYVCAFEEEETQKKLRYHEKIKKLGNVRKWQENINAYPEIKIK